MAGKLDDPEATVVYQGSLKTFSARRGYGFIACDQMHRLTGHDVYVHETQMAELAAELLRSAARCSTRPPRSWWVFGWRSKWRWSRATPRLAGSGCWANSRGTRAAVEWVFR